ncbi:hypothetical protein B0F90DRAFT_1626274 [Multifurca ochricompacta]|uniref:Uncharacterized protein n=1 Tax=Multifurca ochricompacta TaxID=376703 RepID=A0AAD4QNQ0_9AGAM|nr:hypothetical protein B0F90DRAFT_1626274 [Multifurca ochricompacta]
MAELSNNPFIDHSANVASRFPNINTVSSSPGPSTPQYSGATWSQPQQPPYQLSSGFIGANPTGYAQQYSQQPQWTQQPQQPQYQQPQFQASYSPTTFQPPNSYGQQLVGQVNNLPVGYSQPPIQTQYTQASYSYQQPEQTNYGYPSQQQQLLSQFDPYSNLGQRPSVPVTNSGGVGSPPPGIQHPRAYIRSHKAELEAWDPPTWKQVQNTFEALKAAWETRKRAAESQVRALGGTVGAPAAGSGGGFFSGAGAYGAYGGGYPTPQVQEIDRLNALIKEADSNIDTIAAAALQMSEVATGYRHSGDVASKRRVRESCNAAVTGLPEYPPPTM